VTGGQAQGFLLLRLAAQRRVQVQSGEVAHHAAGNPGRPLVDVAANQASQPCLQGLRRQLAAGVIDKDLDVEVVRCRFAQSGLLLWRGELD
jgi:hypothetical protein